MYLKKVKSKEITYLKFVETVWDKATKKRRQKTILNLGRLDTLMENGLPFILKKLAETVNQELAKNQTAEQHKHPFMKDINTMTQSERSCYGHIAYRKLWEGYNFSGYLERLRKRTKISFDFSEQVYLMVVNQLLRPSSKLKLWKNSSIYFGAGETQLQNLYRSLDVLAENKEGIEDYVFQKNRNLFNQKVDIVFYDVTTFYFESQKSDELKDFGFDKDNKVNNVHVVMGLLIDRAGKPIGYELFKGNTYEGHTLLKTLKKLQARFRIDTVVIVADKGLNSKVNLKEIREAGYHYIVSGRLKSMKSKIKQAVFNLSDYVSAGQGSIAILEKYDGDSKFMYKVLDYENEVSYKENPEDKGFRKTTLHEKLICTYSSKRASKDIKDRERMLEKAQAIITKNEKSTLSSFKGHKEYIAKNYPKNSGPDDYNLALNHRKIQEDEQYDGFYVIQSSNPELSAKEVIENYHYLYKIEESFRVMKSTMQVRPVNHWTPKRIEGHFVMSFIAFLLERELELRLIQNNKTKAPEQIKEALNSLEFTLLKIENQEYYIKSKHKKLASEIMASLKIKQPENLLNKTQVEKYMMQYYKT